MFAYGLESYRIGQGYVCSLYRLQSVCPPATHCVDKHGHFTPRAVAVIACLVLPARRLVSSSNLAYHGYSQVPATHLLGESPRSSVLVALWSDTNVSPCEVLIVLGVFPV